MPTSTAHRTLSLTALVAASLASGVALPASAAADEKKEVTVMVESTVNGKGETAVKPGDEVELVWKVHATGGHSYMTTTDFEIPSWLDYVDDSVSMNGKAAHEWAGYEKATRKISARFATNKKPNEHWWGSVGEGEGHSTLTFKAKVNDGLGEKQSLTPKVTYYRGTDKGLPLVTATDPKPAVVRHTAADLAVTGKAAGPVTAGGPVRYRIEAANKGADTAERAKLESMVSGTGSGTKVGAVAVLADGSRKSCRVSGEKVSCDLGTVPAGKPATVEIDVAVPETALGSTLRTSARVSSATRDFHPDNNTWEVSETVGKAAPPSPSPTTPATDPTLPTQSPTPSSSPSSTPAGSGADGGSLAATGAGSTLPVAGGGAALLGGGAALASYLRRRNRGAGGEE
ncbi:hypothetical protein ACIQWR_37805 [Streptomyces sp. NPDC098789]|uniref:hypothetical protein n=1 Tax=Streptomyces sp. NPDC098789 TaxID=3366098 RepID=UPI0038046981